MKIEGLCDERDRLEGEEGGHTKGRVLGGPELVMREQLKWYDPRRIARRGSMRSLNCASGRHVKAIALQHVQAITVAIDQYAEKALGNRDYFLNKPYGVG